MKQSLTTKQALEIIGGLSKPSKMPGYGYGISATLCNIGSKLRNVAGSVCAKCYAMRGFYTYPGPKNALLKRAIAINDPRWVEAMVVAIKNKEQSGYFRWHDAGDIQSIEHLENICAIAKRLPKIKFWLPTREYAIISQYKLRHGSFPKNLTVRLSTYMIGAEPPSKLAATLGVQTSSVHKTSFTCPSSKQNNICGACRKCWNKKVANVTYKQH